MTGNLIKYTSGKTEDFNFLTDSFSSAFKYDPEPVGVETICPSRSHRLKTSDYPQ